MNDNKVTNKDVLVLMSCYNGEKYLPQQLESLKAQEDVKMSCIIRDDGSSDGTVEYLTEYCKENKEFSLITGENTGVIRSFNLLLEEALKTDCKWFAFSDQDDVWLPNKLKRAVELLSERETSEKKPLVYCSNLELVDADLNHIGYMRQPGLKFDKYTSVVQNCATGCTIVFNRSALEKYMEGIDADMEMHDYWMFLIGVFFGRVVYDNKAGILYRQHGNNVIGAKNQNISGFVNNMSKTGNHERMFKDFLKIYGSSLSGDDISIIEGIALANKNIICRLRALFDMRYHGYSTKRTLNFKLRALLGKIY